MSQEVHPVERLHFPNRAGSGAVANFAYCIVILRTLSAVIQRLRCRDYGQVPSGLQYAYVCDTSRMKFGGTEPFTDTAAKLGAITCWTNSEVVEQIIHR